MVPYFKNPTVIIDIYKCKETVIHNKFLERDLLCFTTCFGQPGHLQVIQPRMEFVGGN